MSNINFKILLYSKSKIRCMVTIVSFEIVNGVLWMDLNMRGSHESEKKIQDFCFVIGALAHWKLRINILWSITNGIWSLKIICLWCWCGMEIWWIKLDYKRSSQTCSCQGFLDIILVSLDIYMLSYSLQYRDARSGSEIA